MDEPSYLEYTTRQGDTFDIIALDAYNDEYKAPLIMQANPAYAKVLVFQSGIKLNIPVIEEESAETLPPWKR